MISLEKSHFSIGLYVFNKQESMGNFETYTYLISFWQTKSECKKTLWLGFPCGQEWLLVVVKLQESESSFFSSLQHGSTSQDSHSLSHHCLLRKYDHLWMHMWLFWKVSSSLFSFYPLAIRSMLVYFVPYRLLYVRISIFSLYSNNHNCFSFQYLNIV